jgi:hypothetical protein
MPINQTLALQPYEGVFDIWNFDYSIVNVFLYNAHAGTVSITKAGMRMLPVVYNAGLAKLTAAASANTYNAVILTTDGDVTSLATTATSTVKALLLVRGPAIIKKENLSLVDAAGAAITLATAVTALQTLPVPPIILQTEATNKVTAPV